MIGLILTAAGGVVYLRKRAAAKAAAAAAAPASAPDSQPGVPDASTGARPALSAPLRAILAPAPSGAVVVEPLAPQPIPNAPTYTLLYPPYFAGAGDLTGPVSPGIEES